MLDNSTFHHIGIATGSIEKTSEFYLSLGFDASEQVIDSIQKVKILFLRKKDMPTIELLEPVSEDSPVTKILQKGGVSPYHICYETPGIHESIVELRKNKFIPLSSPVEAIALDNRLICFLYSEFAGLIELLQK
jgi:methylmalonyl-CoA/ethylmalonyl-CoA epimerase